VSADTKTWLEEPQVGRPCTVIAEIAQAHDGSLGLAHAYVDAAARAGADAVKFQTHIAAEETSTLEPWRVRFSPQDETRFDYWRRMEFTADQWMELKRHADEAGIAFLSSPFSMAAVELLKQVGVAGWKVASGEITNVPMLEMMASTGQPMLLSTGMSPFAEIDDAVALIRRHDAPFVVFQCTTQYPSPPEAIGLNVIPELRARYDGAVGLSDHSGTIYPALAAATLGVEAIEVHLTMSREMFGPDVVASVTSDELKSLVEGVRFIERMRAAPVDKTAVAAAAAPLREIFLKSVVPLADLVAGTTLDRTNITTKKPGTGIPASAFDATIGRVLARDVKKDVPLLEQDLEA
jgi:N,N'-diacetyllegionaminate synthase